MTLETGAAGRTYYGTKRVEAWPENSQHGVRGYAVAYPRGYVSWSPAGVFEATYHVETDMPFEGALAAMREGRSVRRRDLDPAATPVFLADGFFYSGRQRVRREPWYPCASDILARWTVVE